MAAKHWASIEGRPKAGPQTFSSFTMFVLFLLRGRSAFQFPRGLGLCAGGELKDQGMDGFLPVKREGVMVTVTSALFSAVVGWQRVCSLDCRIRSVRL